ncbi:hypothetical protein OAO56_04115, partial [Amylibacter sp.]|nr:hypothetical protein [Amylibacter sp.]
LFIASICALGIVLGGYYALNAKTKFTSEATFKLGKENQNGIQLNSEVSTLARLSGFGGLNQSNDLPLDLVMGRVFIEKINEKLNFEADSYFNTYNPNLVDPIWKSLVKSAIGLKKFPANVHEAIWQGIVTSYSKNVDLSNTEEGSIRIKVTHASPQRAAEIANEIMNTIIYMLKNKKNESQDQMLSYLSNTLAKALSDLEVSQSKLKEFALENSAQPLENFAVGSFELNALRTQLRQTTVLHQAVTEISLILENKTADQNSYLALRQKFPIIDQVEFRRVLGQNEIISSWRWPKASTVDAVLSTLSERKSSLQTKLDVSQIDAERSSLTLETFAKLEREAKIAEATYTILIEQVKAQGMVAGFRPNNAEVYEYASVSINPTEPKQRQILTIGAILGLLLGVALSLLLAVKRDVYYSKKSLRTGAQARLTASIKDILPLRKRNLSDLNTMLLRKPYAVLRDLAVEIFNSDTNQVVVTSSRAKLTGNEMARALASYMQSNSVKVAVIDFSSKAKKLDMDVERITVGSFLVIESVGNVSILRPENNSSAIELLSQKDFVKNLQSLCSTIDLLFLCADNDDAISLLRALQEQKIFHVTLARTKYTKSATLTYMRSFFPIQGLIHD